MRYVRPSTFVMMKALDPQFMTRPPVAPVAPPAKRKLTKQERKALANQLVTESNKVTVLGHLHPRRLRKDLL